MKTIITLMILATAVKITTLELDAVEQTNPEDCTPFGNGDSREARSDGECKSSNHILNENDIAQKAAEQANAAQEAQEQAAKQAAHQVKEQLADKAEEAAEVAQAALLGKEEAVYELQQEVQVAENVKKDEDSSLNRSRDTEIAAKRACAEAAKEKKLVSQALEISRENSENAVQMAKIAQEALDLKVRLVESAKHRVKQLREKLDSVKAEKEKDSATNLPPQSCDY